MKLLVLSICKNEAKTIPKLVAQIPRKYKGIKTVEVCIIDDGSTDETAKLAKQHGADLVQSDGVGKGLAFRFREALAIALERDVDILVTIDGDLQFSPKDIPQFVSPIVENQADFVAADRFTDSKTGRLRRPEHMPASKYYGNKVGARVLSNLVHRRFRDVTCGFRAYNRQAILALNLDSNFTYTQESFQILATKRLRIKTIPTHVVYFKQRKSRVVTSVPKYMIVSALNIMRAYRDFAPLRFFFALGLIPMIIGLCALGFIGYHWLHTGQFTPYKFIGFIGLYMVSLGIFLWILGIFADMLVRLLNGQERALELLKREHQERRR